MSLATRLKQARQKKKLTQADLAAAIGVKQQAIQRIEAGKVKSTSYIVQMAKVLDVSSEWLALGDQAGDSTTSASTATTSAHKLPLIEWSDLSNLSKALQSATQNVPIISRVGSNSFAIRVADESMHGSDGNKLGFHRNDILLVDGSRHPHDGDLVIAHHQGRALFREYVNDGSGAYLRAFNSHNESVTCDSDTKLYGVVVNRVTTFL